MIPAVSLLDRLFGRRVMLTGPDGTTKAVTERWLRKMTSEGRMRPVDLERKVVVHIIESLSGAESLAGIQRPLVRHEAWTIGEDVPRDVYERKRDPRTGELHVLFLEKDGERSLLVLERGLWEQTRSALESI